MTSDAQAITPTPLAVYEGDEPLMLLPIGESPMRWKRVPIVAVDWLGETFADQQAPIVTPRAAALTPDLFAKLWSEVVAALPNGDMMRLRRQPPRIGGIQNPLAQLNLEPHETTYSTELSAAWPEYYESKIGTGRRKKSRRQLRRLAEVGEVEFLILDDPAEVDAAIDVMIEQKRARYHQTERADFFSEASNQDFYRQYTALRPDLAQLSVCKVGSTIAAVDWGVICGSTFHGMMQTFDLDLHRLSPGRLLMEWVLEWSCNNGIELYDFSIGDEGYKQDWCEIVTPLGQANVPLSAKGRTLVAAGRARDALARSRRQIARIPAMVNADPELQTVEKSS